MGVQRTSIGYLFAEAEYTHESIQNVEIEHSKI